MITTDNNNFYLEKDTQIACRYMLCDATVVGRIAILDSMTYSMVVLSHRSETIRQRIRPTIYVLCRADDHNIEWVSQVKKVGKREPLEIIFSSPREFFHGILA